MHFGGCLNFMAGKNKSSILLEMFILPSFLYFWRCRTAILSPFFGQSPVPNRFDSQCTHVYPMFPCSGELRLLVHLHLHRDSCFSKNLVQIGPPSLDFAASNGILSQRKKLQLARSLSWTALHFYNKDAPLMKHDFFGVWSNMTINHH